MKVETPNCILITKKAFTKNNAKMPAGRTVSRRHFCVEARKKQSGLYFSSRAQTFFTLSSLALMPTSSASARTRAVMHSTTTTARATTSQVVAAFDFDGNIFAVFVDGLLGSSNGRGRFETSPDNDIASVADTA